MKNKSMNVLSFQRINGLVKKRGFTLAEILLSLTVIGIVAAIALPSLLGNANERAWETQKKALYTRFSQAIPLLSSLNGYGELVGNLPSATGDDVIPESDLKDTATESFVRDGLSKVLKITNICDNDHLTDCGLPDKIIPINGGTALNLSNIKTILDFNSNFTASATNWINKPYEQVDTKAAAFETVNGESILVYYNPNCQGRLLENENYYSQAKMCANFIYDLNGKKGPNTVGKDIGFMSVLYSTNSSVVAPNPYPQKLDGEVLFDDAGSECRKLDENAKLPNIDELSSMFYNRMLIIGNQDITRPYISSTTTSSTELWSQGLKSGSVIKVNRTAGNNYVWCIKK